MFIPQYTQTFAESLGQLKPDALGKKFFIANIRKHIHLNLRQRLKQLASYCSFCLWSSHPSKPSSILPPESCSHSWDMSSPAQSPLQTCRSALVKKQEKPKDFFKLHGITFINALRGIGHILKGNTSGEGRLENHCAKVFHTSSNIPCSFLLLCLHSQFTDFTKRPFHIRTALEYFITAILMLS